MTITGAVYMMIHFAFFCLSKFTCGYIKRGRPRHAHFKAVKKKDKKNLNAILRGFLAKKVHIFFLYNMIIIYVTYLLSKFKILSDGPHKKNFKKPRLAK